MFTAYHTYGDDVVQVTGDTPLEAVKALQDVVDNEQQAT